ncbi:MAG: hypothetical protein AB7N76_35035 [Planctomycetota bacterium]
MSTKTTGEVADLVGLTEARVNGILRRRPELRPPKDGSGRRAWASEHVRALRDHLAAREGEASTP